MFPTHSGRTALAAALSALTLAGAAHGAFVPVSQTRSVNVSTYAKTGFITPVTDTDADAATSTATGPIDFDIDASANAASDEFAFAYYQASATSSASLESTLDSGGVAATAALVGYVDHIDGIATATARVEVLSVFQVDQTRDVEFFAHLQHSAPPHGGTYSEYKVHLSLDALIQPYEIPVFFDESDNFVGGINDGTVDQTFHHTVRLEAGSTYTLHTYIEFTARLDGSTGRPYFHRAALAVTLAVPDTTVPEPAAIAALIPAATLFRRPPRR